MLANVRKAGNAPAWRSLCGAIIAVIVVHAVYAQAAISRQNCGSTHPYVGFTGRFSMLEHGFGGKITILDDCTFRVDNWTYDGRGYKVYWFGAKTVDRIFDTAFQISSQEVVGAKNGDTTIVKLSRGVTWDKVGAVTLWCITFYADFGHIMLEAATPAQKAAVARQTAAATGSAAATPSAPQPPAAAMPLANCATLTGRYFAYWELDNPDPARATSIRMALEGRVPPGHWMGFGFNSPGLTEVLMPGSDVVVAGMVGTEGFAYDYYLQSREQCNYADGGDVGVCPDSSLAGRASANNVELTSFSNENGVIRVEFTRPLNASDRFDKPWIVTRERPITWAMGPLSEASTAAKPIVLYHLINGESLNAPLDFKLDLGAPQFDCSKASGSGPGASSSTVGGNVSTIANVTVFNVTTGPNLNYPNPPAWGLSYHVNGEESPLLRVVRGTEYTFNVMASMQHPFYLTSSATGGAARADTTDETVYAGGGDAAGTVDDPFVLTWTPNGAVPDSLFYQCHTHQKLGWKVEVYDAGDPAGLVSNTTNATLDAGLAVAPAAAPLTTPTTSTEAAAAPSSAATPSAAPTAAPTQAGRTRASLNSSGRLVFVGAGLLAAAALCGSM